MRVALVHDWLTGLRGGEKVLECLIELYPEATLFTLLHIPGTTLESIESLPIRTAFTQNLPLVKTHYRWYLPIFPSAIESLNLEGFDLVISSSASHRCPPCLLLSYADALRLGSIRGLLRNGNDRADSLRTYRGKTSPMGRILGSTRRPLHRELELCR